MSVLLALSALLSAPDAAAVDADVRALCLAASEGLAPPVYRVELADGTVACVHRPWRTLGWRVLADGACPCAALTPWGRILA